MSLKKQIQNYIIYSYTLPVNNNNIFRKILSFLYKLLGRKLLARLLVCSNKCISCKKCMQICPNNAIKFKMNTPVRSSKCKGCFLCVYYCPNQAMELPLSIIIEALLLIFLPYDDYIKSLFSLNYYLKDSQFMNMLVSLLLWIIGYAVAFYVFYKLSFLISILPFVKKIRAKPFVKKINDYINPLTVFPVLIPKNYVNSNKDVRLKKN